ncbi:MAG: ABC transporter ATP-binding protein [Candidatus Lokiarchaeota archaeon]|nr:ABC transporter ATP-binding protein [Candidatus Harpocratesius repetitus]
MTLLSEYTASRFNIIIIEQVLIMGIISYLYLKFNEFSIIDKEKQVEYEFNHKIPIIILTGNILSFIFRWFFEKFIQIPFPFFLQLAITALISYSILINILRKSNLNKYMKELKKYHLISLVFLAFLGILFSIFKILNVSYIREMKLGFWWTFLILGICNLTSKIINILKSESKRIQPEIISKINFIATIISGCIWSIQILYFGIVRRGYLFEINGYGILIILYIFAFLLVKKSIMKINSDYYFENEVDSKILNGSSIDEQIEEKKPVLEVKDLTTYFFTEEGIVRAVEKVSFEIYENENLGLVGETGCGKSVTALSILQLVRKPGEIIDGSIIYNGENLLEKSKDEIRDYRGNKITMIFQDPLNSINPVIKVGDQISEVYLLHKKKELMKIAQENTKKIHSLKNDIEELKRMIKNNPNNNANLTQSLKELKNQISNLEKRTSIYYIARLWSIQILKDVGIPDPEKIYDRYPHELSGGMRQRIMIAMGLACNPKLLLADEPTTALDVTIQAQILELITELRRKYNTSILFISHDLGVISQICDRIAVMYSGKIVESGDTLSIFNNPLHPYTENLIAAVPVVSRKTEKLATIPGSVPNLIYPPSGCRFHPRCEKRIPECESITPEIIEVEKNHFVACHLYKSNNTIEQKIQNLNSKRSAN